MDVIKKNKYLLLGGGCLILLTLFLIWWFRDTIPLEDGYQVSPNAFLKNYEVNEVVPVMIDNEWMARFYLAEYVDLIINDPRRAYELLDEEYRLKAYPNYADFTKYLNKLASNQFYQAILQKYEIKLNNNYKVFDLYDKAGNNFIFREKRIMDYTVLLDNYTLS